MSSREYAVDELRAVLSGMGVADVTSAARYGSGHINDTFKVDCASGVSYILQRINTDIFDPDAVMANIRRVTEHIRAKGGKSLEVVAYTRPWRLYAFIQGAHTVDLITEAGQAYKAASAFAVKSFLLPCSNTNIPSGASSPASKIRSGISARFSS